MSVIYRWVLFENWHCLSCRIKPKRWWCRKESGTIVHSTLGYRCDVCEAFFRRESSFKRHATIHRNEYLGLLTIGGSFISFLVLYIFSLYMLASGTFVIYGKPVICHSVGFKRKVFFNIGLKWQHLNLTYVGMYCLALYLITQKSRSCLLIIFNWTCTFEKDN